MLATIALCATLLLHKSKERLVLIGASREDIIAITDAVCKVLWQHKTALAKEEAGHHDIHLLPNGNILFHDTWTTLKEITLDKKVVWEYDSAKSNGNEGKRVHVHAFARLPDGNTVIVESGVGRIIEVNSCGTPAYLPRVAPKRWVRQTKDGTFLVCSEQPGVTEYNLMGEVVWDYSVNPFGAIRLENGNTHRHRQRKQRH